MAKEKTYLIKLTRNEIVEAWRGIDYLFHMDYDFQDDNQYDIAQSAFDKLEAALSVARHYSDNAKEETNGKDHQEDN